MPGKFGVVMSGKYEVAGRIVTRGKAVKISLGGDAGAPVKFFCFVEDIYKMLRDNTRYVNVYHDNAGDYHIDDYPDEV